MTLPSPHIADASKYLEMNKGYRTLVDAEDFERLSKYTWNAQVYTRRSKTHKYNRNLVYAITSVRDDEGKSRHVRLHRLITNTPKGMVVDHINHDTLDNRKANLRICTPQQNAMNRQPIPGKEYRGVSYVSRIKKWRVRISIDGVSHQLGVYEHKTEAALAFNHFVKKLHGEYAGLNEVRKESIEAELKAKYADGLIAKTNKKIDNYTGTDMEDWQKGYNQALDEVKQQILDYFGVSND